MKKLLLISSALLIGTCVVNAQSRLTAKPSIANKAFPVMKNLPTDVQLTFPQTSVSTGSASHKGSNPLSGARLLGYTCYELQSNASSPRNIINHGDGTVSFCWTIDSVCAAGNAGRGAGYNYWNGTALNKPGGTVGRLETIRTGFARIGLLGSGATSKEVIFAHKGSPYDFQMSTNAAKGSGVWTGVTAGATTILTGGAAAGLWNRIAIGGPSMNSIHLLAGYTDGAEKGIATPTTYSRSTDGGQSWADQSVMLPGYDSTRTLGGSGEAYDIDAQGSTVAVVFGDLDADVTLWKSTDDGATFTRTLIYDYPFIPTIDSVGGATDTAQTSDGAVSVVLGPTGTTHVAYSTMRVVDNGTHGDGNFSIFPGDADLIYWNDVAKNKVHIPIAIADVDANTNGGNGTGAWEVGQYTSNINAAAAATPPSARYGNRAFLTIPSIAVDGNNVFILFSLVSDGDSTVDGQSYRDIWVVASADGGATFGKVQNITCTTGEEEFFSSLAKKVDNYLHFTYDDDTEPGTNIQNGDPIAASEERYAVVSKAAVLAGTAQCQAWGNGVLEQFTNVFNISANYPNPASDLTSFDVYMKENANVSFSIVNGLGQVVYANSSRLTSGPHTLTIDASTFSSGLYFYSFKSGDSIVTGKMTVAK